MQFVAPILAEYLRSYPDVTANLTIAEHVVDVIAEGFDLSIRLTPPPDSSLIVRSLATWRHVLCCSPDYLAQHGPLLQLSDLAGRNCLRHALYPYENDWHFTDTAGKTVSVRVSGNLITNSGETLRAAALRGIGVFLAAGFLVSDDLSSGRLLPLLPDYKPVAFAMNVVYPHRHHLSAKVRMFIDLLAQHSADHQRLMNPTA